MTNKFAINEVGLMATFNASGDGEGVISDYNTHFHPFSVNSSQEVPFLFVHVRAMLGNIVIAIDGTMTII